MNFSHILKSIFNGNRRTYRDELFTSRVFFTLQACTGGVISNLTTGAFMAGLATLLGASDSFNGYLAIIPVIAGMAQLFSPLIFERLLKRKPFIIFFVGLYNFLISSVVFIPLFVTDTSLRLLLLFFFVCIAYISNSLIVPGFTFWLISVVPERKRGRYFGIKDSYALAVITVVSLTMGFVLDSFKRPGTDRPDYMGFVTVFSVPLLLTVLNMIFLIKAKEPPVVLSSKPPRIIDCITKPLANRDYMKVVFFFILWNVGFSLAAAYVPVYMVKYLTLDYKLIMLLNLVSNGIMVFAVRLWGKYADRFSWLSSTILSIGVLAICHFVWGFIITKTMFLLPVAFILGGIAWGGINISLFNLPFMFIPNENKTLYLGFNAFLGGTSGLLATMLGGRIVSLLDGKKLDLGFISFGNIQLIMFMSSVVLGICVLYAGTYLRKLVRTKENRSC